MGEKSLLIFMRSLLFLTVAVIAVVGCGGPVEPLKVKQFTLRDEIEDRGGDPMVEHEKKRRLFGAVSMEERRGRLGQYYSAVWSLPDGAAADRFVIFQYQQGNSGSRVKTIRRVLAPDVNEGKQDFSVIGDDYFDNGRVLAWKMSLEAGGEVIATKQSYLWK